MIYIIFFIDLMVIAVYPFFICFYTEMNIHVHPLVRYCFHYFQTLLVSFINFNFLLCFLFENLVTVNTCVMSFIIILFYSHVFFFHAFINQHIIMVHLIVFY